MLKHAAKLNTHYSVLRRSDSMHVPNLGLHQAEIIGCKGDHMNRFQLGSLFRAKRKGCSDVWVFRWYDYSSGKRIYKKEIIGRVAQIRE
jgi:hypothetical protein